MFLVYPGQGLQGFQTRLESAAQIKGPFSNDPTVTRRCWLGVQEVLKFAFWHIAICLPVSVCVLLHVGTQFEKHRMQGIFGTQKLQCEYVDTPMSDADSRLGLLNFRVQASGQCLSSIKPLSLNCPNPRS